MTTERPLDSIAIIGMGCNFPGAPDLDSFWDLLKTGREGIIEIPAERFDAGYYHRLEAGTPGWIATTRAGLIDDVDLFDPEFFGISPREAAGMDPQQRILLEVSWRALEDAGQSADRLNGRSVGVFVGMSSGDFADLQLSSLNRDGIDIYTLSGLARSILAGRISHTLDLHGPSMTFDTACSSALVALHQACQSIWRGESEMALAGGVNLILTPGPFSTLSMATLLSPRGRCRTFDADADGFARGEGAGMILLKPLSQAMADDDPIYATILATAINNDGGAGSIMTPDGSAQQAVLRNAYARAGISPAEIDYVEAHGTGTRIGDPVEAIALGEVMKPSRSMDNPCLIGSVKTNIGHLESAAGIAGLIKVALSIHHATIPPHLHLNTPNPQVPWEELPIRVQTRTTPWPENPSGALAGVSSFGISGTNVHAVLGQAPERSNQPVSEQSTPPYLLPISAHSPSALATSVERIRTHLESLPSEVTVDFCANAARRRTHLPFRTHVVARNRAEMLDQLAGFHPTAHGVDPAPKESTAPVFVFSGQGPRFWPLDPGLLSTRSAFLDTIDQIQSLLDMRKVELNLITALGDENNHSLEQTAHCQTAIFACQVALAAQWKRWGIVPAAVTGHSLGEVAAAHVAGVLSLDQALDVILARGQVTEAVAGRGAMALVALPLSEAEAAIENLSALVAIAAHNDDRTCVLSGDPGAIEELVERFSREEVFARRLPAIDYAAHSPQMDQPASQLRAALSFISPAPPHLPLYSTVEAACAGTSHGSAEYWGRNLREPVRFYATMQTLLADGHRLFLEVHPTTVLLRPLEGILRESGGTALTTIPHRDGWASMLQTAGRLWAAGCNLDWATLYPPGFQFLKLPPTAWEKVRFWPSANSRENGGGGLASEIGPNRHPLLGIPRLSAAHSDEIHYENSLDLAHLPYLNDHQVDGTVLFPAAGYLEMALAAAHLWAPENRFQLESFTFKRVLFLKKGEQIRVQTHVRRSGDQLAITIYSCAGVTDGDDAWTIHAEGRATSIQHSTSPGETASPAFPDGLTTIQPRPTQTEIDPVTIERAELYSFLRQIGLSYGPHFQLVDRLGFSKKTVRAELGNGDESSTQSPSSYRLYPPLLDACLQTAAAAILHEQDPEERTLIMPTAVAQLAVHAPIGTAVSVVAQIETRQNSNEPLPAARLHLVDKAGNTVISLDGIRFQSLNATRSRKSVRRAEMLYGIEWDSADLPDNSQPDTLAGCWILLGEENDLIRALCMHIEEAGGHWIRVEQNVDNGWLETENGQWRYQTDLNRDEAIDGMLSGAQRRFGEVRGIIDLRPATLPPVDKEHGASEMNLAVESALAALLSLVQGMCRFKTDRPPQLWIVTRWGETSLASGSSDLRAAALVGMGRTLALERPEFRTTLVDLDDSPGQRCARFIADELTSECSESQVALRTKDRLIPRLRRRTDIPERRAVPLDPAVPYRLGMKEPGRLSDLQIEGFDPTKLEPSQVEIEVVAAGLNFLDLLSALAIRPDQEGEEVSLGMECAGIVKRVAAGVDQIAPGDAVLAIASNCFASITTAPADLVLPIPTSIAFEEAAALPIAYLTAHYALNVLGRIERDERILIHSAAGGVGLAALHLARRAGAQIFATAGSPEKRAYVSELGAHNVMDSRSLDFGAEIRKATAGEGIDLVLNALAGDAIEVGLSLLRPNGRFLEIGKRDIYAENRINLGLLRKNVSFFAIDLIPLLRHKSRMAGALLGEILEMIRRQEIPPLPVTTFPIDRAEDAFHFMATAQHRGKIVLTNPDGEQRERSPISVPLRSEELVRSDGLYLISGGLGGIGLQLAGRLVERGARHLILLSRRPPTAETEALLASLCDGGVEILVCQTDVSQETEIEPLRKQITEHAQPLRGIFHLAGLLDDGSIIDMDSHRLRKVLEPKVAGAWNLHRLSLEHKPEHFVLFSSFVSTLGSPGQANYGAANGFLDGLANLRRSLGLPALSIGWGAWARVGMAAHRAEVLGRDHLAEAGIKALDPDAGLDLLEVLMLGTDFQIAALDADWTRLWQRTRLPLLEELAEASVNGNPVPSSENGALRARLLLTPASERRQVVAEVLRGWIGEILRLSPDQIGVDRPLQEVGMDSLMAYELKNQLDRELGQVTPVTLLLQNPTLGSLSAALVAILETSKADNGSSTDRPRSVADLNSDVELDPSIRVVRRARPAQSPPGRVFLTGATGMLGSAILRELLAQSSVHVECLVRAQDADAGHARVLAALQRNGSLPNDMRARLSVLLGDLSRPRLGLSPETFTRLASEQDAIIHCGASVDWVNSYEEIAPVNVGGTREVIRLAAEGSIPLHHISSVAVFPVADSVDSFVDETTSIDGQGMLYNGYAQSKWVAEKLVQGAADRGLPVSIYRPSLIIGAAGSTPADDLLSRMLRMIITSQMAPVLDAYVDMVPVDFVGRSVVELALRAPDRRTNPHIFHLTNENSITIPTLLGWLKRHGHDFETIPYVRWRELLMNAVGPGRDASRNIMPLLRSEAAREMEWFKSVPRWHNSATLQALGGQAAPPIDYERIADFLVCMQSAGLIPPVSMPNTVRA